MIYRTRYRDPKRHSWIDEWSETCVTAEFRRAEIERRFPAKKLEVKIELRGQSGEVRYRAVLE